MHVRQRELRAIVASLARQLGIRESGSVATLLNAVRGRSKPLVIVMDALDEAIEPDRVMTDLLLPMIRETDLVRVLVGMRPWPEFTLLRSLAEKDGVLVDLDQVPRQRVYEELAEYIAELLALTPGLDRVEIAPMRAAFAGRLADTLASSAENAPWGEFLYAMLATHRAVTTGALTVDPTQALQLAEDASRMLPEVFETEISAEHAGPWTRSVLTALSYAYGDGMPATVLSRATSVFNPDGEPTREQLQAALRRARFYLQTSADTDGTTLYRLFHQALADHLRTETKETVEQLLDRILDVVPSNPDGTRQWYAAISEPYLLRHAIQHATDASRADELLADQEFLVYADPSWLRTRLDDAITDRARRAVAIYRTSIDKHQDASSDARRQILAADAARHGRRRLRQRLTSPSGLPALTWQPTWATGRQVSEILRDVLTGPMSHAENVACAMVDGQPIAVTIGKGRRAESELGTEEETVAVWDLRTGQLRYPPLAGHTEFVRAVACTQVNGRSVAVTGGNDHTVRVWDLATGRPYGSPLIGHHGRILAITCTELDGVPVAVASSYDTDNVLSIWDLANGRLLGQPFGRSSGYVGDIACARVAGRPVVVTANSDRSAQVYDLGTRRLVGCLAGPSDVNSVACTEFEGRPVAVTASGSGDIQAWWLDECKPMGPPLPCPKDYYQFEAVACVLVEGRIIVLAGCGSWNNGLILAWDLGTQELLDLSLTGQHAISGLASTYLGRRLLVVATGDHGSLRVWHLDRQAY